MRPWRQAEPAPARIKVAARNSMPAMAMLRRQASMDIAARVSGGASVVLHEEDDAVEAGGGCCHGAASRLLESFKAVCAPAALLLRFEEKFAEEEKEAEFLASLRDENRAAVG